MIRLIVLFVLIIFVPSTIAEDSGVIFRGPNGQGIDSESKPPTQWSQTENLAWKIPLPGPGASCPIVWKDRIYLTCHTGFFIPGQPSGTQEDLKRHLLAIQPSNGHIIWKKDLVAKLPEQDKIRDHGFAASTPAADNDAVYTFFGKSGVYAFDHSGKELWQADVGSRTNGWGSAASPILYKDLLIINASVESESIIALDRKTGKQKWAAKGIKESWNTPIILQLPGGRTELVLAIQGKILAFDPSTGKELWFCKTDITWYMVPSLVHEDGIVYCLGGRSGIAGLAVKAGGSGDVTATHRLWTSNKGSNVSSPVVFKGHLYWTHEQQGIAYCAKADTGKIVYEERLPRAGQFYSSALLANGNLYYLSRDGKTFLLPAQPKFQNPTINDLSDRSIFNGTPVPLENKLLIRSDKFLYCIK
jgi:outer membrane protein assembly factor BamB